MRLLPGGEQSSPPGVLSYGLYILFLRYGCDKYVSNASGLMEGLDPFL